MKINVQHVPDEGRQLDGELDQALLQDSAKYEVYTGPIQYDLHVDTSSGGLLVTGQLSAPVDLRCVRCDNAFAYELRADAFTYFNDELKSDEVDLSEPIREELLMQLPDYPHCDVEGGLVCPGHELLAQNQAEANLPPEGDDHRWDGLDKLKLD